MFTPYSKITLSQSRDTGLAMILLALILGNLVLKDSFFNGIAILLTIITMTKPGVFKAVAVLWFGISELLGAIMSKMILTIIFFGVICPVGFLANLLRKDPMRLRQFKVSTGSVFSSRNHTYCASDLKTPF